MGAKYTWENVMRECHLKNICNTINNIYLRRSIKTRITKKHLKELD